jgi:hypothetical protein
MSDDPPSERLGLRGTLDLISSAFRPGGTANATGAITAGASYRFFSDKPDLQWAIKHITLVFLFGVLTFTVSYIMLFIATVEIDHSLGRSSAQAEWEHIVWAPPQKTAAEYAQSARRNFLIALLFGSLSIVSFLVGLGFVMQEILLVL